MLRMTTGDQIIFVVVRDCWNSLGSLYVVGTMQFGKWYMTINQLPNAPVPPACDLLQSFCDQ